MDIPVKVTLLKEKLSEHFAEIEKIDNYLFRNICLFSIAEPYAQDMKIGNGNSEMFGNFIETYASEPILKLHDPVTLFYDLKNSSLVDNINLSFLGNYPNPVLASAVVKAPECLTIVQEATNQRKKLLDNHKYSTLIYKYRCKLSHELYSPSIIWEDEQSIDEPYYSEVTSIFADITKCSSRWELRFPYAFLKKIISSAIDNYLDDCSSLQRRPFARNRQYLTWYER